MQYTPYDQGIRHIATLAGFLSQGLMALAMCPGILTRTAAPGVDPYGSTLKLA